MGYIDQTTHRFCCTSCGKEETKKVTQYGSSYGAGWGSPGPLENFDVKWQPDEYGEPTPVSMKCKKCGGAPQHTIA